jgi:hypothetical protein
MTKEEILNGMSEEEFYNLYPTEEAYFMAKGGSLSGAPYNGQPTADEFFSYGAPALGHMNIPMSNPTYLAHGGTYFGGPIYPAQRGAATPVPAPDADAFMAKLDTPPVKSVQFPTLNTRGQYDKFKAGNPNFAKYSDADMQGLGVNVPYKSNLEEIKKREQWNKDHPWTPSTGTTPEGGRLFHKTGQSGTPQDYFFNTKSSSYDPYNPAVAGTRPAIPAVTMAYGGVTEYCWGGGLPGGPNEMPEMLKGGYNSPTNYGSFSVPMAEGGYYQTGGSNDLVDWAAKQQQMLEQRTNVGVPPNVKKYFGAFDEPRKFDSTHVYPGDPNIAMGFKGNKVMLISKDGDAENTVRRVNKPRTFVGPTVKGERDVYFDYLTPHEYGGILDASTNQEYPMMEEGGRSNLMKIIKAAAKKMKKEYASGGDITMQGGNQDFIGNRKNTYNNYIKQNVYNSILDQEQQDITNAFMKMGGLYKAQFGVSNPIDMTMNAISNYSAKQPDYLPQQSAIDMFAKQTDADLQERLNSAEIKTPTVEPSNWEERLSNSLQTIGRQAIPIANKWAERLENKPSEMAKQKDIMNRLITPGSDLSAFQAKPANAMNKGDYDPNTGMFRPNAMVPVQFPGGTYGAYGGSFQDGGMFEEGEEYELSPEEIEELKAQGYDIEELD